MKRYVPQEELRYYRIKVVDTIIHIAIATSCMDVLGSTSESCRTLRSALSSYKSGSEGGVKIGGAKALPPSANWCAQCRVVPPNHSQENSFGGGSSLGPFSQYLDGRRTQSIGLNSWTLRKRSSGSVS